MPEILAIWEAEMEDCSSRLAQASNLGDSIYKITRTKWTGGVAEVVEPGLQA
jgi:hypothetical protein